MKNKRLIISWSLLIGWMLLIFFMSNQPADISNKQSDLAINLFSIIGIDLNNHLGEIASFVVRKAAHFTEYFILGVLSTVTVLHMTWKRRWVCGLGFCVAIACLDECLQLFVSGRSGKVIDVLIDGAGALVGLLIVYLVVRIISGYKNKSIDLVV